MLSKLRRHLTYANVMSTLAAFFALAGGAAYAANTVFSTDIVDNEVRTADVRNDTLSGGGLGSIDIANGEMTTNEIRDDSQAFGGLFAQDLAAGSVRSSEVQDGSLNDEDVGEGTSVDFELNIGTVPGGSCQLRIVGAAGATGDHLLLTPNTATTPVNLIYGIEYSPSEGVAWIKACNPTSANIDDGTTRFNLLVFDAH